MNKQIPEGWRKSSIGEITSTNSLFSDGDWVESKDQDPTGANRLIQLADIGDGIFINKSSRYMNDEQFERLKCTALEKNDILIARMPEPLGRACLYPLEGGKAATVVDVAILRTKNANHYWLMSAINSSDYRHQIDLNASGTTRTRIARGILSNIEILEPPLPEQQKIATILTSVDTVIEKTRAQVDKLKDLKTGMMQELLTKGIGHTEFKDSPVGRIPASWDVLHLEELVKAEKNITYGIVQAGAHHDGGVPYIRVSDMTKRALSRNGMLLTSPEIAEKYHRSAVSCGDIVYALRGVIGHVLVVPKELDGANLTQGTARISPNDKVDSGYLLWAMKSPYVNEQNDLAAKGSTFREVTLASLRKIQVALPELSEQKKIASIFDSVELNIFSIEDQLAQLQSIKKALMQDLLTGKVRVNLIDKESAVV